MKINKLFLLVSAAALVACQPKKTNNDDSFQCIGATLTIGGKQVPSVIEWNTKTGAARVIDSTTLVSRSGAQNTVIGWVPLTDLQNVVQEIIARNQAAQQQQQQPQQPQQAQQQVPVSAPPEVSAKKPLASGRGKK